MSARSRRSAPPVRLETGMLAVVLAAGAGLGRLTASSASWRVLIPVVLTSTAGFVTVAAVRRVAGAVVAAPAGVLVVVLVCLWWFEPALTAAGLPTPAALHALGHLVDRAGQVIGSQATPLPATPGIVVWVAGGSGLIAVASRCLLGGAGRFRVVPALLPPTALFCYSALLSSGTGRVWGALAFLGALVVLAVAVDAPARADVHVSGRAGTSRHSWRAGAWRVAPVVAVAGAVLGTVLAVSPVLAGTRLEAFPFSGSGGPAGLGIGAGGDVPVQGGVAGNLSGAGQVLVVTNDLIDDLGAVITGRSQELLFVADTTVPTYWQLGVLTRFDGQRWTPDPVTALLASPGTLGVSSSFSAYGAPPALAGPTTGAVFSSFVSIAALRSVLLPVPPATVSVAPYVATLRPGIGVFAHQPSSSGLGYNMVSDVPAVPSLSGAGTTTAGAPAAALPGEPRPLAANTVSPPAPAPSAADIAPYLALPRIDPAVVTLAHSLVRGDATPLAKASALASYFRSGRFQYTLDTATTPGQNSLTAFLFHSRAGFCQQFAGAYAVLARLVGLPTRVAVGFTPGQRVPDGSYLVTGADAHVWPEVYLGPQQGWLSVEPTPPGGDGQPAQGVLLAPASSHSSGHPASSESPRRGTNSRPAPLPSIPNVPPPGSTHRRAVGHRPVASGGTPIVLWIVLGACVTGAALWWRRRLIDLAGALRRRPARSAVLHSWRRVDRELGRRHPGRFPAETLTEYVERLQGTGGGSLRRVPVPDVVSRLARSPELVELAGMAARACYGDEAPSSDDVARARRLQAELCAAARSRRRVRTPTPGPAHRR